MLRALQCVTRLLHEPITPVYVHTLSANICSSNVNLIFPFTTSKTERSFKQSSLIYSNANSCFHFIALFFKCKL